MHGLTLKTFSAKKVLSILIVATTIIGTGYYLVSTRHITAGIVVAVTSAILLMALILNHNVQWKIKKTTSLYLLLHIISISATHIVNSDTESVTVLALMICNDLFAALCALLFYGDERRIFKSYTNIMLILALISIVGYVLVNLTSTISLPVVSVPGSRTYYASGILYAQVNTSFRNCGLFWEPGIYAEMLSLAILLECYLWDQKSVVKIIIMLAVNLFTVMSTAGYVLCAIIGLSIMQKKLASQKVQTRYIFNILLCGVIVLMALMSNQIITMLADWNPLVFGKIANESIGYTARINGPLISLSIFSKAPLFGTGLEGSNALFKQLNPSISLIDVRVDTITTNLSAFGIGGIVPVVFLIMGVLNQRRLLGGEKILISCFFIAMLFSEPLSTATLVPLVTIFFLENREFFGSIHHDRK